VAVTVFVLASAAGCLDGKGQTGTDAASEAVSHLPDPAEAGDLPVLDALYDRGLMVAQDPTTNLAYPVSVRGSVHHPATGDGPWPLIVIMHGRHGTCELAGFETLGPGVCPDTPASGPVDSFTGYHYIAEPLAAHGYVVVSIDANHVNEKDLTGDYGMYARAQLLARTLDELRDAHQTGWQGLLGSDPLGSALEGRLDLSRIGLVGHSRGGEGVTKFIEFNRGLPQPYSLAGVFSLAPTDFHRHVATGVPYATLLPYCDGDVRTLHGAWIYDDSVYADREDRAPKHQFLVMGANHNFYNTVWVGDDAGWMQSDPFCGATGGRPNPDSGRMTPEDQRRNGLALIAGFMRLYVGGESDLGPMFTGAALPHASACPVDTVPCADRILVSYHAPADGRRTVEDARPPVAEGSNDAGGSSWTEGPVTVDACDPAECPAPNTYSTAPQVAVSWSGPGAWVHGLPAEARDLSPYTAVTFRVGVDYEAAANADRPEQDVALRLVDGSGTAVSVRVGDHSKALFVPPGVDMVPKLTLNMARVPLSAFEGVDLSAVHQIAIVVGATPSGQIQLADLQLQV
jgi:hypothetical protein